MRYVGQGHELDIPVFPEDDGETLVARFVQHHVQRAGFSLAREVEAISIRTALVGEPWPVQFARPESFTTPADGVDDGTRFERTVAGPAVVQLPDATLRVADGWTAATLEIGGWMLERQS